MHQQFPGKRLQTRTGRDDRQSNPSFQAFTNDSSCPAFPTASSRVPTVLLYTQARTPARLHRSSDFNPTRPSSQRLRTQGRPPPGVDLFGDGGRLKTRCARTTQLPRNQKPFVLRLRWLSEERVFASFDPFLQRVHCFRQTGISRMADAPS